MRNGLGVVGVAYILSRSGVILMCNDLTPFQFISQVTLKDVSPNKPLKKIKVASAVTRLTAHFICGVMCGDL